MKRVIQSFAIIITLSLTTGYANAFFQDANLKAIVKANNLKEQGRGLEAIEVLKVCANSEERRQARCSFNIGSLYAEGEAVKYNEAKAIEWYQAAFSAGQNPWADDEDRKLAKSAAHKVANIYCHRSMDPKRFTKGLAWTSKTEYIFQQDKQESKNPAGSTRNAIDLINALSAKDYRGRFIDGECKKDRT